MALLMGPLLQITQTVAATVVVEAMEVEAVVATECARFLSLPCRCFSS
jgi:hypothetical protein